VKVIGEEMSSGIKWKVWVEACRTRRMLMKKSWTVHPHQHGWSYS